MDHLGPTGPRWAPCWPHELCFLGSLFKAHLYSKQPFNVIVQVITLKSTLSLACTQKEYLPCLPFTKHPACNKLTQFNLITDLVSKDYHNTSHSHTYNVRSDEIRVSIYKGRKNSLCVLNHSITQTGAEHAHNIWSILYINIP